MTDPTFNVDPLGSGVLMLRLRRPEKLNALRLCDVEDLQAELARIALDSSCRAVVLTGEGRGFCSGHDLEEFTGRLDPVGGMRLQEAFAKLTSDICSLPQPVVAAVNGPAAGGGLALALAADTRICSSTAIFNAAFVRIGLSGCDVGVSYLLPRIVGPTLAFEMMLSGRIVPADEAARAGLVLRVVDDDELIATAIEICESICRNAPFAVRMTKQVMWTNLAAHSLHSALSLENRTQILCGGTEQHAEALAAFKQDREPNFAKDD